MDMVADRVVEERVIRSAYGPKVRMGIQCPVEEGRTVQYGKEHTDINFIVKKYQETGVWTHVRNDLQAKFGDFATGLDFQELENRLAEAKSAFESLPAHTRAFFGNDPAAMLDFVQDEKNIDKAIELGMVTPEVAAAHQKSKEAPPAAPVSEPPATEPPPEG